MRNAFAGSTVLFRVAVGAALLLAAAPSGAPPIAAASQPPTAARQAVNTPLPNTYGWQDELLDKAGSVGLFSSVTLDSLGYPHIAYYDLTQHKLKYAAWDGVVWTMDTVEGGLGHFGNTTNLIRDRFQPGIAVYGGTAYLLYEKYDDSTGRRYLRYAVGGPGNWTLGTLSPADLTNSTYAPSLRIDTNHNLHASFTLGHFLDIRDPQAIVYASLNYTSTTWVTQTVDTLPDIGPGAPVVTSLALDTYNHPQIAYTSADILIPTPLILARWNTSTWLTQTVDVSGTAPSLAVDSAGRPDIAYLDPTHWPFVKVKYANLVGVTWHLVRLNGDVYETNPSLALDILDRPHIAAVGNNSGSLVLLQSDGATWQTEIITDTVDSPVTPSLALDALGNPHIAYGDTNYEDLHYVAWAPKWQTQTVALNGSEPSIAVDRRNIPYISYNDGSLRLAQWAGVNNWHLDTVSPFGLYNSLQLAYDANLQPLPIFSYQNSALSLELARWNGAAFVTQTVDNANNVGNYSSLVLNGPLPAIAHFDKNAFQIKYGQETPPGGWANRTDTAAPPLNIPSADHSLSLGVAPNCCASYIAYRDGVSHTLRLATLFSTLWVDQLIDPSSDTGWHASLAVDRSSGEPAIAYYDAGQQRLKYAIRDGGNWSVTDVDEAPQDVTGISLQLALGSNQYPRIAYTAKVDNTLRLAWKAGTMGGWQIESVANLGGTPSVGVASRVQERDHIAFSLPTTGVGYAFRSATLPYSIYYNPLQPCVENQPQFASYGQALAQARSGALAPAALAQVDDLTTLRAVRDLFALSPGGQYYINLYYQHARETGRLAVADPSLLWDAYRTLQNFMPGLQALAAGQGDSIVITQAMVDEANDIADRLVAAGSVSLGNAINLERGKYNHLQAFVGKTFDQAATLIGVAPHIVFLPLVRR